MFMMIGTAEKADRRMTGFPLEKISQDTRKYIQQVLGNEDVCKEQPAAVTPGSIVIDGKTVSEATRTQYWPS